MTRAINPIRRRLVQCLLALGVLTLAACDPQAPQPISGSGGAAQVAMLLPYGSGDAGAEAVARSIENAARMAMADLDGTRIDLRVYGTAGNAARAGEVARQAVDEGADIIIGPLFAEAANGAGAAIAGTGINIMSFSNNADIAGGNVFVLGYTFEDIAGRIVRNATGEGRNRFMVVYPETTAGQVARQAAASAIAGNGATIAGMRGYPFNQQDIVAAAPAIASDIKASGSTAVILTDQTGGGLALISQMLVDNGITAPNTRFLGLTRWDIPRSALILPGLQGGRFVRPDPAFLDGFTTRYVTAYGVQPNLLAPLGYDAMAAVGALASTGGADAFSTANLTRASGFVGASGIFRLRADGTSQHGLAIAEIQDGTVTIVDPAPRRFGGAGF